MAKVAATTRRKPKPKPKPVPKYTWILSPGGVNCYVHPEGGQTIVTKLWEAEVSEFHDAELQAATKEINKIIERVERSNKERDRHLCMIEFDSRMMLVWSRYDVISPHEDSQVVAKGLKVRDWKPQ